MKPSFIIVYSEMTSLVDRSINNLLNSLTNSHTHNLLELEKGPVVKALTSHANNEGFIPGKDGMISWENYR